MIAFGVGRLRAGQSLVFFVFSAVCGTPVWWDWLVERACAGSLLPHVWVGGVMHFLSILPCACLALPCHAFVVMF